jgi:glycosyltransferase involved in cell wall biosynthesis
MVGSAPWTKAQFYSKGVEALLEAAQLNPQLRLIFLWRGVLTDKMINRVERMNLSQQVEVIDKQVDVNQILAKVHASIALATTPGIIKSHPHSLLDSLAAGKPVLVSRAIPMSDYVEQTNCGQVVEQVTAADILASVNNLIQNYTRLQASARDAGQKDFSQQAMINSFQKVYHHALQNHRKKTALLNNV